jgi:superfamily II DNA/RNA helicase
MSNSPEITFRSLGVSPALCDALEAEGKTSPFPIQTATLPDAINGRDVLGRGQTGSGKTLAFSLAMMTRLNGRVAKPHKPLGLILSPTRELAVQINEVVSPLSRRIGLSSQVVAGGLSYIGQIQALKRGVPIIVATPGRLIDLLEKKHIDLSDVMVTVLDEADQMADMGFLPVVKEILSLTKDNGQRLLFSATLDRDVDALVKRFLKDPITHSLENEKSRSVDMQHHILIMDQGVKDEVSTQIAAREGRTIFFVRTKHGADKLADKMLRSGVPVGVLHGGKSQAQRTRVLKAFKDGRANALVATDVAARGIHVDDVSLVVHVDAPADHKDYLHRAGRTARAGATGTVVTLATHKQKKAVFGITNRAAVKLIENQVRPSDPTLIQITGAQEPSGIPVIVEAEKSSRGDRKPGSRNRTPREGNFRPRHEGGGREERSFSDRAPREDRSFGERPVRTERKFGEDRGARSESAPRTFNNADRTLERQERSFRTDRPDRSDRSERPARAERPTQSFREAPARTERPSQGGRPFRSTPKKWEDKARPEARDSRDTRDSRDSRDARTSRPTTDARTPQAGNRGRVEGLDRAPKSAQSKARMPLEKRIAMEKAESRARTGKPAASAGGFKKKPASAGGFKKKTTGRPKIAKNQRG